MQKFKLIIGERVKLHSEITVSELNRFISHLRLKIEPIIEPNDEIPYSNEAEKLQGYLDILINKFSFKSEENKKIKAELENKQEEAKVLQDKLNKMKVQMGECEEKKNLMMLENKIIEKSIAKIAGVNPSLGQFTVLPRISPTISWDIFDKSIIKTSIVILIKDLFNRTQDNIQMCMKHLEVLNKMGLNLEGKEFGSITLDDLINKYNEILKRLQDMTLTERKWENLSEGIINDACEVSIKEVEKCRLVWNDNGIGYEAVMNNINQRKTELDIEKAKLKTYLEEQMAIIDNSKKAYVTAENQLKNQKAELAELKRKMEKEKEEQQEKKKPAIIKKKKGSKRSRLSWCCASLFVLATLILFGFSSYLLKRN